MISIKTSRQIKRTETEEFILKLQKVLGASMNLTITIPICKTSLWFLPRLQSKPSTVYYIFSVYLKETSETVYCEIIRQVRYFWTTLTSQTKMKLTNSQNVELSFDFGHQVTAMKKRVMDIATGRFLRVLVGGQLGGAKCGASKVVNERNWCYQTFLNMSEVKTITREYMVMNGSGKVLYSSQYDILVKNTSMIIVTCIRELDEENDGDMVMDNVSTIAQDVGLVTETSVAILICFTLVVAVVVLHAIFRRYIKRREDST